MRAVGKARVAPSSDGRPTRMHVISHTHWDREWYQDFQGYRRRLVHQVDALLELLERNPDFHSFLMDGQTAWIDDYLAMRPEQRERLAKHLRNDRIQMGPWFVMPDELLLSGESLVRNLALGHRQCADFGAAPLPVGYVTDIFGHCSQFPQILRGFGIDCAMLHRGTSGEDETCEMVWEGADGSRVLLVKVHPDTGYNDFLSIRWGQWDDAQLRAFEDRKQALATTPVLFALDGNDHEPAREDTLALIVRVNGVFSRTTALHSSLRAFLADLRAALEDGHVRRRVLRGELRTTAKAGLWNELMTGTASSRVPLKQANDALEWLLARGADPLQAWARVLGADRAQEPFLSDAWRHLLLNHPHDSIVGCSIDQVHRDMAYRFDQARLLGEQVCAESLTELTDRIDTRRFGAEAQVVTVVNLGTSATGAITRFSFECDADTDGRETSAGRRAALFDERGQAVSFDVLRRESPARAWPLTRREPGWYRCRPYREQVRYHVAATLEVPGLGYRTLRVAFVPAESRRPFPSLAPVVVDGSRRRLENDRVSLSVEQDGSVTLRDRSTGVRYSGLHVFEDRGDTGDGWNHMFPTEDRTVLSTDAGARGPVTVTAEPAGPLSASLTVRFTLRVPADAETIPATKDRTRRTRRTVRLAICTRFTLVAGDARVECRTTVMNTARRHRLRVLLPTRRDCQEWFGDSAFDVVERAVALPDTAGWKEPAREETPVKNVVAAQDGRGALAVLTHGLQEACVRDTRTRDIALTLFRSFSQTLYWQASCDSLQLGENTGEYAIVPLAPQGNELPATVMREVDRYKAPCFSLTRPSTVEGTLPPCGTLLQAPAPLCLSTVKGSDDGRAVVVRLVNPLARRVRTILRLHWPVASVLRTDLREVGGVALSHRNGRIPLTLAAKEVVTLRLEIPESKTGASGATVRWGGKRRP